MTLETPRFEMLEETTHFPPEHKSQSQTTTNDSTSEQQSEQQQQQQQQEQAKLLTLEEQLEQLQLGVDETGDQTETNVKKASEAKEIGNKQFGAGKFLEAIDCYTTALKLCPVEEEYTYNRAVYFSNRAACLLRLNRFEECVEDCNQAVELSPNYVKALLRRAEAYEKMEKLDEALRDLDAVLKIDPTIQPAVKSHARIKPIVDERNEKMKAEMMEKLKGFGNTILGKFGLSTDNFQVVQDPNTGSYNINFKK